MGAFASQYRSRIVDLTKVKILADNSNIPSGDDYDRFVAYINDAEVGWVRFRYVRKLASTGQRIPRRQEVPSEELLIGSQGSYVQDCDNITRWVISHPWRCGRHPDPDSAQLRKLVEKLELLGARDTDVIFYDYMSFDQNDLAGDAEL